MPAGFSFFHRPVLCVVALVLSCTICAQTPAQKSAPAKVDLTLVKPESVGFSTEGLEQLHKALQATVDQKQIAGIVTLLARHGKVVDYRAYGLRDIASGAPMTTDTIFRDYSMTKPVTGVAMMILYEQGKWKPSDPIAKYIPEFAHLKVAAGVGADGRPALVDPDHAPTLQELATHTAGFTSGRTASPADKLFRQARVREAKNLQISMERLALVPLSYQPGQAWVYSYSMDIQGHLIEKFSGQSLSAYMREKIFEPLGMKDAGFYVPARKRDRFATLYENDRHGGLLPDSSNGYGFNYSVEPTRPSGGGGMVSTAEDYYRFALMLANKGELDGHRILSPESVKLMTTNHLAANLLTGKFSIGQQTMRPGFGYGYNCAVVFDPAEAHLPVGKGTFFWDGAAGTWFWVDPTNDVIFVGMIQRMKGGTPNMEAMSRKLVYQALADSSK